MPDRELDTDTHMLTVTDPDPTHIAITVDGHTVPADNIPAPVLDLDTIADPALRDAIMYLYDVARRVESIIDQVTPAQIERTRGLMSNPLIQKMMSV